MKTFFLLSTYCLLLTALIGCATVTECAKSVAGVSTKVLEDGRKEAIAKTFDYDYNTCYNKTKEHLGRIGAYIYAQDEKKKMIAIYISETDTTPVGLFFKEIEANKTQIEVYSPSIYSKEFIAKKIFDAFNPEEKKGISDAQN